MSDAPALTVETGPSTRINAEQWIYDRSPAGTFLTSAAILVLLAAVFLGAAALDRMPVFDPHGRVAGLGEAAWPAFVLSLLLAVVLGTQRYARQKNEGDEPVFARLFQREGPLPDFLTPGTRLRLIIATVVGLAAGAGLTVISLPRTILGIHPFVTAWFFAAESLVLILFARGIVMSARSGELFSLSIRRDLHIDLLRIDRLAAIGRYGARIALVWFSVAAVICLFFVGDNMAASTLLTVLGAAGIGIWIFMQPMMQVHKRIRAAKEAELEILRHAIADLRVQVLRDPPAATQLQGLLAYEKRIEDVREWPFDQTTALRLTAYVFIPAIPWFGQAIAQYFVERLAQSG